ncbi:SLOG family protein [Undibacterium sp. Ji42W]|uniref:SLOG family protein n=1 Tax=Undibacterium sp. Ji42W TaxID=3413039 RepID=UPI003BF13EB8
MRVLITGATNWDSQVAIRRELAQLPPDTIIVTGDTPGIDAHAKAVAAELGFTVEAMKKTNADYRAFPGEGWKGLNVRMLTTGIDLVLAFHTDYGKPGCARGTQHAVELAEQAKIPVKIFTQ